MRHDPEQDAAGYLGGCLSGRKLARFEEHLLTCQQCWDEVASGREGRALAESARELAPQSVRENIRASVLDGVAPLRTPLRWKAGAGLALVVTLLAAVVGVRGLPEGPAPPAVQQPGPVAQAIIDFQNGRVPAGKPASHAALDLSQIGFRVAGAGGGEIGDMEVDGYAYLDNYGRRLQIYMAEEPFPEAAGATNRSGSQSPWSASAQGIEILCAEKPMSLLALSDSPGVLQLVSDHLEMA
ncbi:MAG: hypothetical protein ACT4OM_03915 [Actinomycetota bacterium]